MTEMSHRIEIGVPIETVFDFVANPENDPLWCPRVIWCRRREGAGVVPGARYEALHSPTLQRRHSRWIELLEVEAPRRVVTLQRDNVGAFTIAYELEPAGAGTSLTQRDEIDWKVPRAFVPVGRRIVRRHLGDQLSNLKRLLEKPGV
jgi:uncharacterized protein YndB with AHSA1/START domain